MRFLLLAVLVACGGGASSSPPPISNQPTKPLVAEAPPAPRPTTDRPTCDDSDYKCAITYMEYFQKRMCDCKDKQCADTTNENMTTWGMQMAKRAGARKDEKPDPDIAKRSADIMTRYVECMTKLMMSDTKAPPDPCGGGDPCGN